MRSVAEQLAFEDRIFGAVIAFLLAAGFAAVLGVRAWKNTNRINAKRRAQAERRAEAWLRSAGYVPPMDSVEQSAIRKALLAAAAVEFAARNADGGR